MNEDELYTSTLVYGGPGVGKTTYAVSAFWDWVNRQLVGNGKLITLGREDNPALMVPEECRQLSSGKSLRLGSPSLDSLQWADDFDKLVTGLLVSAKKGETLDALVIDGMSEVDLLYEHSFARKNSGDGDKFAKWDALLRQMFASMQRLDPQALKCNIIVTARVMEKRQAKESSRSSIPGDPDFMNFDYYPSMRGSFKYHLPHYFNLVLYMETAQRLVTGGPYAGRRLPVHVLNMVRTGKFYVKNQWENEWLRSGERLQLMNPSFHDVYSKLVNMNNRGELGENINPGDFELDTDIEGGMEGASVTTIEV